MYFNHEYHPNFFFSQICASRNFFYQLLLCLVNRNDQFIVRLIYSYIKDTAIVSRAYYNFAYFISIGKQNLNKKEKIFKNYSKTVYGNLISLNFWLY